jgi:hypothetical protein
MTTHGDLPEWAPRVSQQDIRRLYEDDARGIHDDELLDEVGYGLLARCESFIAAVEAVHGRALCPRCGAIVEHGACKDELLQCSCGWELPWRDYFATIQHKQLSGAKPVLDLFRHYVRTFPSRTTARAKMLAIDALIHGFHYFYKTGGPTRPVAVNLIEGRLNEVIDFLDALTYGPQSTDGLSQKKQAWDEKIQTALSWRNSNP